MQDIYVYILGKTIIH